MSWFRGAFVGVAGMYTENNGVSSKVKIFAVWDGMADLRVQNRPRG